MIVFKFKDSFEICWFAKFIGCGCESDFIVLKGNRANFYFLRILFTFELNKKHIGECWKPKYLFSNVCDNILLCLDGKQTVFERRLNLIMQR